MSPHSAQHDLFGNLGGGVHSALYWRGAFGPVLEMHIWPYGVYLMRLLESVLGAEAFSPMYT